MIGVKNDKSKGLNQELVKGLNVLKNKQNFIAFEDDEDDIISTVLMQMPSPIEKCIQLGQRMIYLGTS